MRSIIEPPRESVSTVWLEIDVLNSSPDLTQKDRFRDRFYILKPK